MNRPDRSILLVEDDVDDQYFILRAFKEIGRETPLSVASDGQSAIDFFQSIVPQPQAVFSDARPGLVLLDLNLPRRSGLEVLRWIRNAPPWKSVAVVMLTSSTSDEDMRQAYGAGANAYVIKPADPTQLNQFARLVNDFWLNWNQTPAPSH